MTFWICTSIFTLFVEGFASICFAQSCTQPEGGGNINILFGPATQPDISFCLGVARDGRRGLSNKWDIPDADVAQKNVERFVATYRKSNGPIIISISVKSDDTIAEVYAALADVRTAIARYGPVSERYVVVLSIITWDTGPPDP